MLKKILFVSSVILLLGACSSKETTEKKANSQPGIVKVDLPRNSILSSEITTIYRSVIHQRHEFTDEELVLFDIISERSSEKEAINDRTIEYEVAEEYGVEPSELSDSRQRYLTEQLFSVTDNLLIDSQGWNQLDQEVVYKNILARSIEIKGSEGELDRKNRIKTSSLTVDVEGITHELIYQLQFSNDWSTAELIMLSVDGNEIKLD